MDTAADRTHTQTEQQLHIFMLCKIISRAPLNPFAGHMHYIKKNFLAGRIQSLRGPHAARGPYVWHPWSRTSMSKVRPVDQMRPLIKFWPARVAWFIKWIEYGPRAVLYIVKCAPTDIHLTTCVPPGKNFGHPWSRKTMIICCSLRTWVVLLYFCVPLPNGNQNLLVFVTILA